MSPGRPLVVASQGLPSVGQLQVLRRDLPTAEWSWILRLRQRDDQLRSITGRALARRLLGQRLGMAPARVPLTTGTWGKPVLDQAAPAWHFNIAHSGDLILVGLAGAPLGVDVEHCPSPAELDAGLWRSLTRQTGGPPSAPAFCAQWVWREAALKACGLGFALDPSCLRLGAAARGWQRVAGTPHADGFQVHLLWQSPAHCAALCLAAPGPAEHLVTLAIGDWADSPTAAPWARPITARRTAHCAPLAATPTRSIYYETKQFSLS